MLQLTWATFWETLALQHIPRNETPLPMTGRSFIHKWQGFAMQSLHYYSLAAAGQLTIANKRRKHSGTATTFNPIGTLLITIFFSWALLWPSNLILSTLQTIRLFGGSSARLLPH